MPYVAHKRLVTVIHLPYHTVYHGGSIPSLIPIRVHARVRPSVLAAEINRIRNLTRPSTESYTEKYLQSKDHIVSLPRISDIVISVQRNTQSNSSFVAIKRMSVIIHVIDTSPSSPIISRLRYATSGIHVWRNRVVFFVDTHLGRSFTFTIKSCRT